MNKIIFTAIIIFIANSDIYCMKRKPEQNLIDHNQQNKRQKFAHQVQVNAQPAPIFIQPIQTIAQPVPMFTQPAPIFITYQFIRDENKEQNILQQRLNTAIHSRNLTTVMNCVMCKPKYYHLIDSIKEDFFDATSIILGYGNPTQEELDKSLNMAIDKQNKKLINTLLDKGARLNEPLLKSTRSVLSDNFDIINLVAQHTKLSTAMRLKLGALAKTIATKRNIDRDDIDEGLKIALQEGYEKIIPFLTKIRNRIFGFTKSRSITH